MPALEPRSALRSQTFAASKSCTREGFLEVSPLTIAIAESEVRERYLPCDSPMPHRNPADLPGVGIRI
jgi:hypothetical protein